MINASHLDYNAKSSYRKLKSSINKNCSVIKTALGWILIIFGLMFLGGILSQVNAYLNWHNIIKATDVAVMEENGNDSSQVICRQEGRFYKYWNYMLSWLKVWILLRMMTSAVRMGIKGARVDLRNQIPAYGHRACKSMPMICMPTNLRDLLRRFHYLSLSLSFFLSIFFFFFFFWLLYM